MMTVVSMNGKVAGTDSKNVAIIFTFAFSVEDSSMTRKHRTDSRVARLSLDDNDNDNDQVVP